MSPPSAVRMKPPTSCTSARAGGRCRAAESRGEARGHRLRRAAADDVRVVQHFGEQLVRASGARRASRLRRAPWHTAPAACGPCARSAVARWASAARSTRGTGSTRPGVVRRHGGGRRDRLQLLPGPPLLPGAQPRARRGQGPRGAAVAGVHRVHSAGAAGHGVRRGDEPDAAGRDRRAVGRAARPSSARRRCSS